MATTYQPNSVLYVSIYPHFVVISVCFCCLFGSKDFLTKKKKKHIFGPDVFLIFLYECVGAGEHMGTLTCRHHAAVNTLIYWPFFFSPFFVALTHEQCRCGGVCCRRGKSEQMGVRRERLPSISQQGQITVN